MIDLLFVSFEMLYFTSPVRTHKRTMNSSVVKFSNP